jgi:ribosome-binding factor A
MARINEEFLRAVSTLLPGLKDPRVKDRFISVLRAEVTSDLKYAKIYISVFGEGDNKQLLKGLESSSGFLRRELGTALQLRAMPELRFIIDDSIEQGARMTEMMKKIKAEDEAKRNDA